MKQLPSDGTAYAYVSDQAPPYRGDHEIREYGFTIVSRPVNGPVLWRRNGGIYPQPQVERMISTIGYKLKQEEQDRRKAAAGVGNKGKGQGTNAGKVREV